MFPCYYLIRRLTSTTNEKHAEDPTEQKVTENKAETNIHPERLQSMIVQNQIF